MRRTSNTNIPPTSQREPKYSIKYAGIVDGFIGILSRREKIGPRRIQPKRLLSTTLYSTHRSGRRRTRPAVRCDPLGTGTGRPRAEIEIPAVKSFLLPVKYVDEENASQGRSGRGSSPSPRANVSVTPPPVVVAEKSKAKKTPEPSSLPIIIPSEQADSPWHQLEAFADQDLPRFSKPTSVSAANTKSDPAQPHYVPERVTGKPNPRKYDVPLVHTYLPAKRLACYARQTSQRRRIDLESAARFSCRASRRGFRGSKIVPRTFLLGGNSRPEEDVDETQGEGEVAGEAQCENEIRIRRRQLLHNKIVSGQNDSAAPHHSRIKSLNKTLAFVQDWRISKEEWNRLMRVETAATTRGGRKARAHTQNKCETEMEQRENRSREAASAFYVTACHSRMYSRQRVRPQGA